MKIALTGATGNMGVCVVSELIKIPEVKLDILAFEGEKRIKEIKKICRGNLSRVNFVYGGLTDRDAVGALVKDADYVVNMAAVIPPHSDKHPELAVECNEKGADVLCSAIEELEKQPKLIHISTVALYGNRNSGHAWARVGDPLLVSPFDIYAITKMRGEYRVLESEIKYKTVLRQTAMLHDRMLKDNMDDGLMFHTCFNAPLEWVTAEDSGVLIAEIIKKDVENEAETREKFWNKCFNIGGGAINQVTGYDVLNDGFEIIGGSVKDFFEPEYNATRNFHGVWFYDGGALQNMFGYQRQSTSDFWKKFGKNHGVLKLGKAAPKSLIRKFAIRRLYKDGNSPYYWLKNEDEARITAYYGEGKFSCVPKNWKDFPLLIEGKDEEGKPIDYLSLKDPNRADIIDLGFDPAGEVGIEQLAALAKLRGGKLISVSGGLYDRLEWENCDGERFFARGYTVLCGHFLNKSYKEYCWDFDRLAKTDKLVAAFWYDSHERDEGNFYYFDGDFRARRDKIK